MIAKLRKVYETGTQVNDEPLVFVFEDYLSGNEFDHVPAATQPKLKRALVSAANSGVTSAGRCLVAILGFPAAMMQLSKKSLRIAEIVSNSPEYTESLQVIYYNENDQYAPHYDAWDKTSQLGQRYMEEAVSAWLPVCSI